MIEHKQYYRKGGTYELPIEIYNDLIGQIEEAQKERNNYKSRCKKTINAINILQEIIYQQPTENGADDMWLLDKLDGFKNILNGSDENE